MPGAFPVRWARSAVDRNGGVNRTVVRRAAGDIRVFVNGDPVLQLDDRTFSYGQLGVEAITWGTPRTVSFDNIRLT